MKKTEDLRTCVIQTLVTPTMRDELITKANNLGLSVSSYTELLLGQALSNKKDTW